MMDGGDIKTLNRWHGGDSLSRQHGGIFGLLGKLLGLGLGELSDKQHCGILSLLRNPGNAAHIQHRVLCLLCGQVSSYGSYMLRGNL